MKYEFAYEPQSPYGHLVDLLIEHVPVGVVIDLGCGHAAIAQPLIERGHRYVGVDMDPATIEALTARGIEAHRLDLADTAALADGIVALAAGRPVVAITALDVVEHLPRPVDARRAVHEAMVRLGAEWLGVSIPNVAHADLAGKLLVGRWDVTPTGLLDDTHVSLFTAARLGTDMAAAGFAPGPANDFHLEASDQHYPTDLATLSPTAPLARLLRVVRDGADADATTNQFVRLFRRTEQALSDAAPDADTAPFLTVVVHTGGTQPTLADTLTSLAAQTCPDFEVLLLVDAQSDDDEATAVAQLTSLPADFALRVRSERLHANHRVHALNRAIELARGRYVAILDDDQQVLANWVADFSGALADPGALLRSRALVQHGRENDAVTDATTAPRFDFVQHLRESETPLHCIALPMSVFRDLGLRFDPELQVYAEFDLILRAAQWCGVTDTEAVTAIQRPSAGTSPEHDAARAQLIAHLDSRPLLLPEGSATRLLELLTNSATGQVGTGQVDSVAAARERVLASPDMRAALSREGLATRTAVLLDELAVQRDRADRAEAEVAAFERSRVWRATKPLRMVLHADSVRRIGGKLQGRLRAR